jgi:hypothetical protein
MNNTWYETQVENPDDERTLEQERLIFEATEKLYGLMEDSSLSKSDLARTLNTSRAYITQTFNGNRNLTLRTLSDFAWACGHRITIDLEPLAERTYITAPIEWLGRSRAVPVQPRPALQLETVDFDLAA